MWGTNMLKPTPLNDFFMAVKNTEFAGYNTFLTRNGERPSEAQGSICQIWKLRLLSAMLNFQLQAKKI